jgi:tetratricopeptide (TPR) repeat protein
MTRDDWYRNTEWTPDIEKTFHAKLARARRKAQYLRIQACVLAKSHPAVALRLLDDYFESGDDFDEAQAHVDRATAYRALGQNEKALHSYECALAVEAKKPFVKTQAYIQLPYLVATTAERLRYEQALDLLERHKTRLTFPVDHFLWHATRALILGDVGSLDAARMHAAQALEAAAMERSGLRRHPSVGLVGDSYNDIVPKLTGIANA